MKEYKIDIHLHTSNSDGDFCTAEIVEMAKKLGVEILAFTDHETIQSYYDLKEQNIDTTGIKIPLGVEINSCYQSEPRDILGYDYDLEKMQKVIDRLEDKDKLIKGQKIILEDYKKVFTKMGVKLGPIGEIIGSEKHEAYVRVMEAMRVYKNENLAKYPEMENQSRFFWDNTANKNTEWYVDETRFSLTIKDVIDMIHEADGLAFFAHPCIHGKTHTEVAEMLDEARSYGLDGVEVKHARHSLEDRAFLREYADKHGIYKCGGSDFHGASKPEIQILTGVGDLDVHYKMIEPWFKNVKLVSE